MIVQKWIVTVRGLDCLHIYEGLSFCSKLLLEVCKFCKRTAIPLFPRQKGRGKRVVVADVTFTYCVNVLKSWFENTLYLNFLDNTLVYKTMKQPTFSLVFLQQCNYAFYSLTMSLLYLCRGLMKVF